MAEHHKKNPARLTVIPLAAMTLLPLCHSGAALAFNTSQAKGNSAFSRCMAASKGVTSDMKACLSTEYARLDRELNVTYKSAMGKLKTAQLRKRLVESQRVWIWRRDYDCKSRLDRSPAKGGTAGDLVYQDCLVTTVRERILWLQKVPSNPGYLTKV